jgi:prolipoprotein diacylglyceryltransferase
LASFGEWLLIFIVTNILFRKQIKTGNIQPGKVTIVFLILYATIRFFLEYVRVDSQGEFIGIFTISQYFFIAFIIIALALWFVRKKLN